VPLTDAWVHRRFAICFRERASLSKAESLPLDHLVASARDGSG
jgi:hypothetical protein